MMHISSAFPYGNREYLHSEYTGALIERIQNISDYKQKSHFQNIHVLLHRQVIMKSSA